MSLLSFWLVSFLNEVIFLASTPHLSDLLAYCEGSRASLDSVTSMVFTKLHDIFNTLLQNRLLDDFAQLQANVSVLSTI